MNPENQSGHYIKSLSLAIHNQGHYSTSNMKAVIFDLDGTLLDTLEDIADAVNAGLAANGFPPHSKETYRTFIGKGADNLVFRALPKEARDEATVKRCLAGFHEVYSRNWNKKTRPYPGIAQLLDALISRGIKLAVLSNKPQRFTSLCVTEQLSRWTFEAVLGASETLPLKPDPAGALEIARRLTIAPKDFIYIGDSAIDIKTARAAGMFAVGALWGFRGREELEQAGAQALIERPEQLLGLNL